MLAELSSLAQSPRVVAIGETGLDYYRDWADPGVQREWFRAHIELARRTGKTLMIHDREAHADVLAILAETGPWPPYSVIFHCFSGDAAMAAECAEAGYVMSFAGNVTFKNADPLRAAALVAPPELMLAETDAPYLTPIPHRGKPNSPADDRVHDPLPGRAQEPRRRRVLRPPPGHRRPCLRPGSPAAHPRPKCAFGLALAGQMRIRAARGVVAGEAGSGCSGGDIGASRAVDVRPTKKLGQNFVVEPGTVRQIAALAAPRPGDVVLEVGPGLGSLTLALLEAAVAVGDARVVAVEIDPVLAAELPKTIADRAPEFAARVDVVTADALGVGQAEVGAPTVLAANLPYNVAVPVLLTLLAALPSLDRGIVMVQAEVADRMCAGPGSRVYGAPSAKLAWYASARPAGNVPRSRLLADAERGLQAGGLHQARAAADDGRPGRGLRRGRRRLRPAPQDPAGRARRLGRVPGGGRAAAAGGRGGPGRARRGARDRRLRPHRQGPPRPRRPRV